MPLQGHKQRVKCNSDLNGEKVWGALRRCPASRGYTQRAEPPVLRVAATPRLRCITPYALTPYRTPTGRAYKKLADIQNACKWTRFNGSQCTRNARKEPAGF